jgi:lipoprotein NlpI
MTAGTVTESGHRTNSTGRSVTWMLLILVATGWIASAEEPLLPPEVQAKMVAEWDRTIRDATASLENDPKNLGLYSRRGDAYFFSAKFPEAVADYDRMVELDPGVDASHWRRGIALFYAGRYADAAGQFERYHSFDDVDRENGIWRYLSQVKAHGREKARQGLLKYAKDDREPFPAVYELFAGRTTPEAVMKSIAAAKISPADRQSREFYARLYIGLNEVIENRKEAREHLELAARNPWWRTAGYGPHYMGQVARLQAELLRKGAINRSP